MTVNEAKRMERSSDPAVRETAKRVLTANRRRKEMHRRHRDRSPGPTREERRAAEDARSALGKAAAMKRSESPVGIPRCEVWHGELRCLETATDADHVLGGSDKRDMEALPNGEGFRAMCRVHHGLKHANSPTGLYWLREAAEHAERIGSTRLARLVARALALYEGKHPERRSA